LKASVAVCAIQIWPAISATEKIIACLNFIV
jgi:hypothetical protein